MPKQGRPTKYCPEILEKVKKFYDDIEPYYESPVEKQDKSGNVTTRMERIPNTPPSKKQLAQYLGVSRDTIYDWQKKHPTFSDTLKARDKDTLQMLILENGLLGNYNAPMAIFAAKNMLGWADKTEVKQDLSLTLPDGIKVEFIDP